MPDMRARVFAGVIVVSLCALACSSEEGNAVTGTGGASGASGAGGTGGALQDSGADAEADAASSACLALDGELQAALDSARAEANSPDAVLAVTTDDCGRHVYVSGDSGIGAEDLFRIGSVTKTYTASVVLRLVSQAKLSLSDVVESYVPNVPNGSTITLRMLLNHTSGLYNYTDDSTFLSQLQKTWTPTELVQIAANHPVLFAPGTQWDYSNTNYVLAGMIAEQVGGKGIEELIRTELLTPNSLAHTFLDGEEPVDGSLAPGYLQNGNDATNAVNPSFAWAAGAMVATPADTGSWIELLGGGAIHDASIQAELETPTPTTSSGVSYGLGVFLLSPAITGGAGPGVGHGGDIFGYHTQAFHFPQTNVTIVAIVNKDGTDPNGITAAALTTLFP